MTRPATTRMKVNPPLGNMPALQYLLLGQLKVDPAYQRSLDTGPSQTLIRRIAQFWNWDLCQPLVVARRHNGDLYVIDGQHRLEAARLRSDIAQLPAVVVEYANAADEAASFVHLNQQRRPLSKLDVFKAAVASGDTEACAIVEAMKATGLSIAPHSNYTAWKPGMVANIAGIEAAWRTHGANVATVSMKILALAFSGQRLQFAGTIFPGIVAVVAREARNKTGTSQDLIALLKSKPQSEWRSLVMKARADDPTIKYGNAAAKVVLDAWARRPQVPAPPVAPRPEAVRPEVTRPTVARPAAADGKRWCNQCEMRVSLTAAALCKSRYCKLRPALVSA